MRKTLILLVLVASLLWQGFSVAHALPDIEDAMHAVSHVGAAHHHESDGSTHFDDSDESVTHMQADHAGTVTAALPETPVVVAPDPRHGRYRAPAESPPPDPFLSGLDRPPRRT